MPNQDPWELIFSKEYISMLGEELGYRNHNQGTALKAQIMEDVHNVFMNPELFADHHVLDNTNVPAFVTNVEYKEEPFYKNRGLLKSVVLVSIAQDALNKTFKQGDNIDFDGQSYVIEKVNSSYGLLDFYLSTYEI